MLFKNIKKFGVFLMIGLSHSVYAQIKDHHYYFTADVENQDEDKISSNNMSNDDLFLGFEAPLFESIQSQWGALVSTASMNADALSLKKESTKFGLRTIWSTPGKTLTPFLTTSVVSDNTTALTYSVGAGVKKNIFHHLNAGLAYSVADQNILTIDSSHLYSHNVLLSLSYKA